MSQTVFDTLTHAKARLTGTRDLGAGMRLATWANECDSVRYDSPPSHTVSLYLDGGAGSRRRGIAGHGWAGAICLIPQGSYSDWDIVAPFRFAHLYFAPAALARFVAEALDRDPRGLTLPDRSFVDDAGLRAAMAAMLAAEGPLAAEAALSEMFARVAALAGQGARVTGGLSAPVARRVVDYLDACADRAVTLDELAEVAGLSAFHLQRMFTARFGTSPHRWHEGRRIAAAKARLARGTGLAEVAAAGGWSSQSHLTRAFRAATGVTPGTWARAAMLRQSADSGKWAVDSDPGAGK